MIGFRTRRHKGQVADSWTTHPWVDDELLAAMNHPKQVSILEVRETLMEEPTGMLQQRLQNQQWILYDETKRDRCLVEIALALGRWHRQRAGVQFTLLPDAFGPAIRPLLRDPVLRCIYRVVGESDTEPKPGSNRGGHLPAARELSQAAANDCESRNAIPAG